MRSTYSFLQTFTLKAIPVCPEALACHICDLYRRRHRPLSKNSSKIFFGQHSKRFLFHRCFCFRQNRNYRLINSKYQVIKAQYLKYVIIDTDKDYYGHESLLQTPYSQHNDQPKTSSYRLFCLAKCLQNTISS